MQEPTWENTLSSGRSDSGKKKKKEKKKGRKFYRRLGCKASKPNIFGLDRKSRPVITVSGVICGSS